MDEDDVQWSALPNLFTVRVLHSSSGMDSPELASEIFQAQEAVMMIMVSILVITSNTDTTSDSNNSNSNNDSNDPLEAQEAAARTEARGRDEESPME